MSLWEWLMWGAMLLATLVLIGVGLIFSWAIHQGSDTLSPEQGARLIWALIGSFLVAVSASLVTILVGA